MWGRPRGKVESEALSVYGPSGSGKTFFSTYVMTQRARLRGTHAVQIATKKADTTLERAGWPIIDDWPPDYGKNQVIWWARGGITDEHQEHQRLQVARIMNTLWTRDANKIVAWDELTYICGDLRLRTPVTTYYREGRTLGITNVAVMQRPSGVSRYVHSEVAWTVAFSPKDQDDRDRVAEVFGHRQYYREVLQDLDRSKYEFLIKHELSGRSYISSLPGKLPSLPQQRR